MTVIWGTNYAIVKHAFHRNRTAGLQRDPDDRGVVGVRRDDAIARRRGGNSPSGVFYTPHAMTRRELLGLAVLGVVGQSLYQYLFIGGLARTSVANSAVSRRGAPVMIAIVSGVIGEERIGGPHWAGAALSLLGIYIVVGPGVHIGGSSVHGDLLMLAAMGCWSAYTLGARPLMARHSPVAVSGISMAVGTAFYVPRWPATSSGSTGAR